MKYQKVIILHSYSNEQDRFIFDRFTKVSWIPSCGVTTFYIDINEEEKVKKTIEEWNEFKKMKGGEK